MEIIQMMLLIFALFAFSRSVLRFNDRKISGKEFLFWSVLWAFAMLFALLPGATFYLSEPLGISRGVDFVVYFSIVLIFYLLFRLYVKIDKINQDVTKVVRELAKRRR